MLYQQRQILIRFVENSLVFPVFLHTGFQVVALDDPGDAAEVFVSMLNIIRSPSNGTTGLTTAMNRSRERCSAVYDFFMGDEISPCFT